MEIAADLKNDLEALAKTKGMTIDELLKVMINETMPKRYLAKSIVSKKNATNVPSVIRDQLDIAPGTVLLWDIEDSSIILKVEK